jgi:hypothetical protein
VLFAFTVVRTHWTDVPERRICYELLLGTMLSGFHFK